jgi:hypothetical protein
MRSNSIQEAILSKYFPSTQSSRPPKIDPLKKKKSTLADFYQEVHAHQMSAPDQVYLAKNAKEIEIIMMQNRKLIEAKQRSK